MARTNITAQAIPNGGLNLTDATYSTLGVGADNGVTFDYDAGDLVVLKNATGGSVTYTFKVPTPTAYAAKSLTVPDVTVVVATAKTVIYALAALFRQDDGKVYVDCSAAANLLVLSS